MNLYKLHNEPKTLYGYEQGAIVAFFADYHPEIDDKTESNLLEHPALTYDYGITI